jgi:acyl-CoA synthetase (NDP forming)
VPDIGKLLWPRSVAVVGASSDTKGLRGRILLIMKGHPFAGSIYPVSRSESVVQGLAAFRSVEALPAPADLAVLIIPAKFVPQELERCGAAGIRAATILSSGFAEELGGVGLALQDEVCAIAKRYDMAVSGPNAEGFANTAAALCPTFSPVMEAGAIPLLPPDGHRRGQVAVISQSGGMGFAFFDHGRPKHLSFRYIVTTGNEACLETFDFVDYMLDEGKTDAFLLLLEEVKNLETFRRVAAKALRAGKPLIIGKLGQSEAGSRAVRSHTAAQAGAHADYRALFARYGVVEGRDIIEMVDIAQGFLAFGSRLPAGRRVGICTSSGGGGALAADACVAAGLDVPELDGETRALIDVHLPSYGTSQNPVDVTAQAVHALGYAEFARLVAGSPAVDGVIVVVTGRSPRLLIGDREKLTTLARETPSRSSCGAIPSRRRRAANS